MYRGKARTLQDFMRDIIIEIDEIKEFIGSLDFRQFLNDRKTLKAVVNSLANISEAAKEIPPTIKNQYPSIPWKNITGMRNRIMHEYFSVNVEIVWDVANNDMEPLKTVIEDILARIETGELKIRDNVGKSFHALKQAIESCDVAVVRMLLNAHRQGNIKSFLKTKDSNGYTFLDLAKKLEFSEQNPVRAEKYQKIIQYLKDAEAGKEVGVDIAGPQSAPDKDPDQKNGSNDPGKNPAP